METHRVKSPSSRKNMGVSILFLPLQLVSEDEALGFTKRVFDVNYAQFLPISLLNFSVNMRICFSLVK